ncbi:MAG: ABC transporter ATP-binding protein [Acidobacteria bacterium]|nr:ABC transporter ATP-binding protein [Acidobacteriota bacterium]
MSAAASKLLPYLLRYRRRFAAGSVFLVCATAIQVVTPLVLGLAVDDLAAGSAAGGGAAGGRLGLYAGVIVAMACAGGLFRFLTRRIIIGASRDIEYDLRNAFFVHLQRLPQSWFQGRRTGDLMSRATNDLSAVRMMAGPAVMYTATTSITFVAALGLMLSISPSLTLLALVPLPLVSIVVKRFGDAIYDRSERIQAQLAHLSAVVQEALAGVRVVRAYRREEVEIDRFRDANREYVARNRQMIRVQGVFHPSLALLLGLSALVVLWIGSRQVIAGRLTVGDFVAFNAYVAMLSWPVIAFGWVTNMLQRGMAAWRRMLDVLEVEPAAASVATATAGAVAGAAGAAGAGPDPAGAGSDPARAGSDPAGSSVSMSGGDAVITAPADLRGRVEFRNLTFGYNGRRVLSNISARVEPGQVLALVGPTGSGKSTLVDLLPRLFEPPRGTVFVDGVDVRALPLPVLRGAIGYVPQEPFLFSTTVAENVAFGAVGAVGAVGAGPGARANGVPATGTLRAAVERAAAVAQLDGDVRAFPDGFETAVGERGITLSGGQKQRVALARALVADPRILILDDALSAVDTHTEEAILSRLRVVMRQRTSIVVSHRVSTVRDADLILVLDDGRVIERGTHDTLVARQGVYAGLHRKQLLARALEGD